MVKVLVGDAVAEGLEVGVGEAVSVAVLLNVSEGTAEFVRVMDGVMV